MAILSQITLALALLLQGAGASAPGEIFDAKEKSRLEKARNVEGRIKVYESASKRIQHSLEGSIGKEEFDSVPEILNLWAALLTHSLEDIQTNLKTKKKSRALINYEIQIRKSISNMENAKIKIPVEQQDAWEDCLAEAEKVRKRFVEILFHN